jgi:hypothetical protein
VTTITTLVSGQSVRLSSRPEGIVPDDVFVFYVSIA